MRDAEERVGRKFERDRRGERRLFLGSQRVDVASTLLQHGITGFDREREFRIALSVFVPAIDLGFAGQLGEFQQRFPHHRQGGLENAAAAEREERIAGEEGASSSNQ